MRTRFEYRLLLWTLVALAARLLWIALEPGNRIVADEGAWLAWGLDVLPAADVRFSPLRAQMIFHPPVYPYFIGLVAEFLGGLGSVKVAQAVVGALLVPAVGILGRRAFGERAGLAAAAFVALYPELVWFSAHFWAETLFTTVVWWAFERYSALLVPVGHRVPRETASRALTSTPPTESRTNPDAASEGPSRGQSRAVIACDPLQPRASSQLPASDSQQVGCTSPALASDSASAASVSLVPASNSASAASASLLPQNSEAPRAALGLAILSGMLLGLAILTRETVLYLLPFMALGLLWQRGRRGLLTAGVFLLATAAVVTPWTWRNHVVFGAFVPVSTSGGLNLYQGNARLTRQQVYDEWHAVRGRIAKYQFARKKGIEAILDRQPWWIFEKLRDEMPNFWEADSQALVHVRRGAYGEPRLAAAATATAVVVLPYLALLVLFVLGVRGLPEGPFACLVVGFLAYYTLLHVATHGYARYRLPALPALFLVAGVALAPPCASRWRNLTTGRRLATVATALVLALSVLPSLRFLVRADTIVSENARFGLDPQGQPLEGEREGGTEP